MKLALIELTIASRIYVYEPACGTRAGFGGGISSPAPHDIAATRRFSRLIVSQSLTRSSSRISLRTEIDERNDFEMLTLFFRRFTTDMNLLECFFDAFEIGTLMWLV